MADNFDVWNLIKKDLSHRFDPTKIVSFPKRREVWMCVLGQNVGSEQNGTGDCFIRPVLVIKKFNNQMFWVVPLSSKQRNYDFYYNFTDPYAREASCILSQLKLISIYRFDRPMYTLSVTDFKSIIDTLKSFLS